MTPNQAVRGRLAELFVLEVCWRRFLRLDQPARKEILDVIVSLRDGGSAQSDALWGTKTAWRELVPRLEQRRRELETCRGLDDEHTPELAKLFRDLIEVANELGPGFDVLDPFGAWGVPDRGVAPKPSRVEIKAILPSDDAASARVVLTTNEFHRARSDPASYVLRLIAVPPDPEDTRQVHWVCDVCDPIHSLDLDHWLQEGVRGGSLPLLLRVEPPGDRVLT